MVWAVECKITPEHAITTTDLTTRASSCGRRHWGVRSRRAAIHRTAPFSIAIMGADQERSPEGAIPYVPFQGKLRSAKADSRFGNGLLAKQTDWW